MLNRLIHKAYLGQIRGSWGRALRAMQNPAGEQARVFRQTVLTNSETEFGRTHGFERIRSIADFQDRVPISSYESLQPWIARVADGQASVLTAEPVKIFERTSGSTSCNKLIPYTQSFLDEINSGTQAWLYNIYSSWPKLQGTSSYWSISPVVRERATTAGGIPIGMSDDLEYFGAVARWAISRLMAVPSTVALETTHEAWKIKTCQYLLLAQDLGLISVWSPTFLTLLMDEIAQNLESYLQCLPLRRALQIRQGLQREGQLNGSALWPRLQLISCWTEASAAQYVGAVRKWFPKQIIQGKGLMATEGIVSFPLAGHESGGVVACSGHFLEFLEVDRPEARPKLAHQLEVGARYSPLLTTGGGLYRYHLKDVVECTGHYLQAPSLRFLGRLDSTSDICGEKVSVQQVQAAFDETAQALNLRSDFFMVLPVPSERPYYCALVSGRFPAHTLREWEDAMEAALLRNTHYAYCRKLGQLQKLQMRLVDNGYQRYVQACLKRGMRLGDIKPLILDGRALWREVFATEIMSAKIPERVAELTDAY